MNKLRKAWALPKRELVILLEAAVYLATVHMALRLIAFKRVLSWIRRRAPLERRRTVEPRRLAYLVEVAAQNHALRLTCLDKSLVLYGFLRKNGVDAEFSIGTLKKNGVFEAHAWVEYEGAVILGRTADHYAPLCTSAEIYD